MALGRGIRVYHSPGQQPYTVLLEQRGQESALLLESQAILSIGWSVSVVTLIIKNVIAEGQRLIEVRSGLNKLYEVYGVLGNLQLACDQGLIHYLVLVTGCSSVGKVMDKEVRIHHLDSLGLSCAMHNSLDR